MKQQVMKAGNLLATAYMLIMFVLYPFYMKNGYADLGEAKYHFFFYVTTAAVILGRCHTADMDQGKEKWGTELSFFI